MEITVGDFKKALGDLPDHCVLSFGDQAFNTISMRGANLALVELSPQALKCHETHEWTVHPENALTAAEDVYEPSTE